MRLAFARQRSLVLALSFTLACSTAFAGETVTDFEGLPLNTPESWLIDGGPSGGWTIDGAFYTNEFGSDPQHGDYWSGWAFSNQTAVSSGVAFGQFLAMPGSGAGGSSNYGIVTAYADPAGLYSTIGRIDLAEGRSAGSIQVTNVEYAYNSITDGFGLGGGAFESGDWFKLTIEGLDSAGSVVGTIDVNLAAYTDQLDVLTEWLLVDLTSLGDARSLNFVFTTSVWNSWGPLTPLYAAVDDLTTYSSNPVIPEPASWLLLGLGVAGGAFAGRRHRRAQP